MTLQTYSFHSVYVCLFVRYLLVVDHAILILVQGKDGLVHDLLQLFVLSKEVIGASCSEVEKFLSTKKNVRFEKKLRKHDQEKK